MPSSRVYPCGCVTGERGGSRERRQFNTVRGCDTDTGALYVVWRAGYDCVAG